MEKTIIVKVIEACDLKSPNSQTDDIEPFCIGFATNDPPKNESENPKKDSKDRFTIYRRNSLADGKMVALNRTKTLKSTSKPVWNHEFTFQISPDDPHSRMIFNILDWSRFSSTGNSFLGQVVVPSSLFVENHKLDKWFDLASRPGKDDSVKGKLHLHFHFPLNDPVPKIVIHTPDKEEPVKKKTTERSQSSRTLQSIHSAPVSPLFHGNQSHSSVNSFKDCNIQRSGGDLPSFNHITSQEAASTRLRATTFSSIAELKIGSDPSEFKRQLPIIELVETEKYYLEDLHILAKEYMEGSKALLTKQQFGALFSNLETLIPIHEQLYKDLEKKKMENLDTYDGVAQVFLYHADLLKMYAVYCSNQPSIASKLHELIESNPEFDHFLKECFLKPTVRKLDLSSYLIKPLQRLCKYPLLINEIYKNTNPNHPEYNILQQLLTKLNEIVALVNERTRKVEEISKLTEIEESFETPNLLGRLHEEEKLLLVSPSRYFIMESICKLDGPISSLFQEIKIFLFNDLLLLGKCNIKKKKKYHLEAQLPLKEIIVYDIEDSPDTFEIWHSEKEKSYTIQMNSPEDKITWLNHLQKSSHSNSHHVKKRSKRDSFSPFGSLRNKSYALDVEKQLRNDAEHTIEELNIELKQNRDKLNLLSEVKHSDDQKIMDLTEENQKLKEMLKLFQKVENGMDLVARITELERENQTLKTEKETLNKENQTLKAENQTLKQQLEKEKDSSSSKTSLPKIVQSSSFSESDYYFNTDKEEKTKEEKKKERKAKEKKEKRLKSQSTGSPETLELEPPRHLKKRSSGRIMNFLHQT